MNESKYPESIQRYGVFLHRLKHKDIEMVRLWRTKPEIVANMEYRGEITPEMQETWFQKVNNDHNFFFISHCKGIPVGLVNLKDYDEDEKNAEGGEFIGEPEKTDLFFGLRAALAMYDYGFEYLGLETITIHVLRDNPGAIRLNLMMGFVLQQDEIENYNQKYLVTREQYQKATAGIKKRFETM